jgi:hypothetical protein
VDGSIKPFEIRSTDIPFSFPKVQTKSHDTPTGKIVALTARQRAELALYNAIDFPERTAIDYRARSQSNCWQVRMLVG